MASTVTRDGTPVNLTEPWARVSDLIHNPDGYPPTLATNHERLHDAASLFPKVQLTDTGWTMAAHCGSREVWVHYQRHGDDAHPHKVELREIGSHGVEKVATLHGALDRLA